MPRKLRELRANLRQVGWEIARQRGRHQIWKHALLPGVEINLAGADGNDAHRYQERDVSRAVSQAQEVRRRQGR